MSEILIRWIQLINSLCLFAQNQGEFSFLLFSITFICICDNRRSFWSAREFWAAFSPLLRAAHWYTSVNVHVIKTLNIPLMTLVKETMFLVSYLQESSVQEEVEMMVESLLDVLLQTLLAIMSKSQSQEAVRGQRCPQCTAEITVSN